VNTRDAGKLATIIGVVQRALLLLVNNQARNINPHQLRNPIRLELLGAVHPSGSGAVRKGGEPEAEGAEQRRPNGRRRSQAIRQSMWTDICLSFWLTLSTINNAFLEDEVYYRN
jgi:hypothetical protein